MIDSFEMAVVCLVWLWFRVWWVGFGIVAVAAHELHLTTAITRL